MTFDQLNLSNPLLNALNDLGISEPTPIQEKTFSLILSGRDVLGIAQTGTGKTFAYLLPCLRDIKFAHQKTIQVLILVPTRELVKQVVGEVEKLTTYMDVKVGGVFGGVNMAPQKDLILAGLDILVATPGRLLDLILSDTIKTKTIKKLVIDEVDEMLDLGFKYQLSRIFDLLPPKHQNILFSATMIPEVENLIALYFNDPVKVEAATDITPLKNIVQTGYNVKNFNTKANLIPLLLKEHPEMTKVIVFLSTKSMVDLLFSILQPILGKQVVDYIHSNKAQNKRFATITNFDSGNCRVLIATDIIARGLDLTEVTHVINFDTPPIPESYVHRIGRTGRADKKGIAITLTTEKEQVYRNNIEALIKLKIELLQTPDDLVVSNVLIKEEIPVIKMKNILVKKPKKDLAGPAFHQKKAKNLKTNSKIPHAEKMRLKYGKPIKKSSKK
ncbi:MAG: DEAD/DEAH box helicase [Bacteroidota bacterium]